MRYSCAVTSFAKTWFLFHLLNRMIVLSITQFKNAKYSLPLVKTNGKKAKGPGFSPN